ncbi:transporter substrate-binding domain-containing protein, partial [Vibrio campbellii]|uniref:transporter substrate-binding domain-containing protein n=2 Tax=Vibrio TaxID=662 RepID=UPI003D0CE5E7
MKKILLASLIGVVSTHALAQEEIKFVMEATYPPFEYMDESNQIQGFDVDLANALCEEMKAKCTFHNQAFDSLIPALKFKRYDAAISAMDITDARLEQVSFSNAYYDNAAAFIALEGKVADQAALEGKRVGVQNGSTHQSFLMDQMPGVTTVPYSSYQDAFIDMKNGRIDSVFGDNAVVAEWFKDTDNKLAYIGENITNAKY